MTPAGQEGDALRQTTEIPEASRPDEKLVADARRQRDEDRAQRARAFRRFIGRRGDEDPRDSEPDDDEVED